MPSDGVYQGVERADNSAPRQGWTSGRRLVVALGVLLAIALVLLSPVFGRADPAGSYRPSVPPDALTNGCWPLPGDVRLDFAYQVRTDDVLPTTEGPRRHLVVHYDQVSGATAVQRAQDAFAAAGVEDVVVSAADFTGIPPEALVRGEMVLDLPPSEPEGGPTCQDPFSTKQFPRPLDDRS